MSDDENPKIKIRRLPTLILLLSAFAVLALGVFLFLTDIGSTSTRVRGFFSRRAPVITANEFNFDVGRDRMFAHMNGSIAAVGTLGVQVLDERGRESLRDPFRMIQPAINSSGSRSVAFDVGGSAVRVFDKAQINASMESDGRIVSASINNNGWFCVVTQEGGGIRGVATVYDNSGLKMFSVSLGSGFILSAEISPDNKNLAVLNMTDTGSRITLYHSIDTHDEPAYIYDLSGGLIIDIKYLSSSSLLAISTDSVFLINSSGERETIYSFTDKRLGGYSFEGDFISLHLYDYGIGHGGRIVTFLSDGTILGELVTDREVLSISAVGKALIVLKSDGIMFFNEELEETPVSTDNLSAAGASRVLAVSEDVALATSDSSAVVIRKEEER